MMNQVFSMADEDGDGRLSYDEFCKFLNKSNEDQQDSTSEAPTSKDDGHDGKEVSIAPASAAKLDKDSMIGLEKISPQEDDK